MICEIDLHGTKRWYINGKLNSDGGLPAVEYVNGNKRWFVNDKLHRDDGLPACEDADGASFGL